MAGKRNRIIEIKDYLESFGIKVNICKNKAQGNKGFFKVKENIFRIDIANGLTEDKIISTLVHEFSHFIHYRNDKSLQKLDFVFGEYNENIIEDMIKITVNSIPKDQVKPLFDKKAMLEKDIAMLKDQIKTYKSALKQNDYNKLLEKRIKQTQYKHLLKYDKVKVINFLSFNIYSVDSLCTGKLSEDEVNYIKLKSKQRELKRLNSRINKYNRYYNSPTELFARSMELYVQDREYFKKNYPELYKKLDRAIVMNKIPELNKIIELTQNKS